MSCEFLNRDSTCGLASQLANRRIATSPDYCKGCLPQKPNLGNITVQIIQLIENRPPSIVQKAQTYAKSTTRHVVAGRQTTSDDEYNRRVRICETCDFHKNNVCTLCGCQCKGESEWTSKLRRKSERCPIGKWEANAEVLWEYGITTVPSRLANELPITLESLAKAGFTEPRLFVDGVESDEAYRKFNLPVTIRNPKIGVPANWILGMWELYSRNPFADRYAIFQDDIIACSNLRKYLDKIRYPERGYLNLIAYPQNEELVQDRSVGWYFACARRTGLGAQGLVFSREAVEVVLTANHLVKKFQGKHRKGRIDGGIVTGMRKAGWKEYFHFPGLIYHIGDKSTMGHGPQPRSRSFRGEDFDALELLNEDGRFPNGLSLITCTGDRPEALKLLNKWMNRQIYQGEPIQWIVIDDGKTPSVPPRRDGWDVEYVRRVAPKDETGNTILANMREAFDRVAYRQVLIIEDDDWYGPEYLQTMVGWLENADLVGEAGAKYYHLRTGPGYQHWTPENKAWFKTHCSLTRTGFNEPVFDLFRKLIQGNNHLLDNPLWEQWGGSKYQHPANEDSHLHVAIKGVPGREGVTWSVKRAYCRDADFDKLEQWTGDYSVADDYADLISDKNRNDIVLYTCVLNGYDKITPIDRISNKCRAVVFSDTLPPEGWEWIKVGSAVDPSRESRIQKIQPHLHFPDAEWWYYIDGSMTSFRISPILMIKDIENSGVSADIYMVPHSKRDCIYVEAEHVIDNELSPENVVNDQMRRYREEGFPEHYGLYYCGYMIRRNNDLVREFSERWWAEVEKGSHRDQLSCMYVIWKMREEGKDIKIFDLNHFSRYVKMRKHRKARPTYA